MTSAALDIALGIWLGVALLLATGILWACAESAWQDYKNRRWLRNVAKR